jgi:hypothetical protein
MAPSGRWPFSCSAISRMMLWRRPLAVSLTSGNTPHEITNPGAACLALPNARMNVGH